MEKINSKNFEEIITAGEKPVVVTFWSGDCDKCKDLLAELENLKQQYDEEAEFVRFNLQGDLTYDSQNSRLALDQGVKKLPAVIIYRYGEKKEHLSKAELEAGDIKSTLDNML